MKALRCLRRVLQDPVCRERMNKSTVTGFLGELLVEQVIAGSGELVLPRGNQAGVDLELPDLDVRLDVKCSTVKQEFGCGFQHWGWALRNTTKRRISASHIVCVALDEALEPSAIFVVKARDVRRFPKPGGQFRNVEHSFMVPLDAAADYSALRLGHRRLLRRCDKLRETAVLVVDPGDGRALLRALRRKA